MDSDLLENSLLEYLNLHNFKAPKHNFYLENRIILSSPPSSPFQRFIRNINTDISSESRKELNTIKTVPSSKLNREIEVSAAPLIAPPNYHVRVRSHYETEKHNKRRQGRHKVTSNPKKLNFMKDYGNPNAMFSRKYYLYQEVTDENFITSVKSSVKVNNDILTNKPILNPFQG